MSAANHNPSTRTRLRILFLCNGNSCRSQMTEGRLRDETRNFILTLTEGLQSEQGGDAA